MGPLRIFYCPSAFPGYRIMNLKREYHDTEVDLKSGSVNRWKRSQKIY